MLQAEAETRDDDHVKVYPSTPDWRYRLPGAPPGPPTPPATIPYDASAPDRALRLVEAYRYEGLKVHGLTLGAHAFASLLAFTLAKPGADIDAMSLSTLGCSETPCFGGWPMFLDLSHPPRWVAVLAAFEGVGLSEARADAIRRALARANREEGCGA